MLILTRKKGESIMIGDDIQVVVDKIHNQNVYIGIQAPRAINIARSELYEPHDETPITLPNIVTLAGEHAERYADDDWQRVSVESFLGGWAACQQFVAQREIDRERPGKTHSQALRDVARRQPHRKRFS